MSLFFFVFVRGVRHLTLSLSTIKINISTPYPKKRLWERNFNFCPTVLKYAITYQKVRLGTGPYDNQPVSHTSASSMSEWVKMCSHETCLFEQPASITTTNNNTYY